MVFKEKDKTRTEGVQLGTVTRFFGYGSWALT
jgi:hypothetical protein